MSGKRKILITVDEKDYTKFAERAKREGFSRPSNLVKHLAISALNEDILDTAGGKRIKVYLDNYEEVEAYVREKKFGAVPFFATFAMEQQMQRVPLTEAQKRRLDKNVN